MRNRPNGPTPGPKQPDAALARTPAAGAPSHGRADVAGAGGDRTFEVEGTLPGEPLFVPRPGGSDEDDGAVLAMATDADGGTSLYVLDAKDMSLLARARSPIGLPAGFHGEFVPS